MPAPLLPTEPDTPANSLTLACVRRPSGRQACDLIPELLPLSAAGSAAKPDRYIPRSRGSLPDSSTRKDHARD